MATVVVVAVVVVLVVGGLVAWASVSLLRSEVSLARSSRRLARQRQAEADRLRQQGPPG